MPNARRNMFTTMSTIIPCGTISATKRDLREHQREVHWYYGDSWALRQHQREERHDLKYH
jgi:hypothetical protein